MDVSAASNSIETIAIRTKDLLISVLVATTTSTKTSRKKFQK